MANPRRQGLQSQPQSPNPPLLPLSSSSSSSDQPQTSSILTSVSLFLKRPQAFPFLLSIFVLLTWLSLRLQRPPQTPSYSSSSQFRDSRLSRSLDLDANLVRFNAVEIPSGIAKDKRGWLVDPVSLALENGIHGGARFCASVHVGEIRPGKMRGNHRHHTCNETFVIWGAETKFRLENPSMEGKGYAEVIVGADEVAVAVSPAGTAHALINVDHIKTTFLLGCQDSVINISSTTEYKIWKDL
ncbi:uncharacterized protein A4U43_C08F30660 [Asparagus officinalis]|uniref:uncharacterized protein LOC109822181 n=1 Tax=Asparagus officinalis TaxID=4686 RepID=UPI00098DEDC1|nr:uncharacterized protein LOC109822181 [Asparagus officinalis]ONK61508.1 uncharacterized protein A4U43_C08F30660 [Asparagus officinalis]